MGSKGRWEYLRAIYERYQKAERKSKRVILNEFCANTGYNRKYAIRLLSGPPPEKRPRPPRRRGVSYGQEVLVVLTAVWEAAGYPWSLRLKALLPAWMPWIRKMSQGSVYQPTSTLFRFRKRDKSSDPIELSG